MMCQADTVAQHFVKTLMAGVRLPEGMIRRGRLCDYWFRLWRKMETS